MKILRSFVTLKFNDLACRFLNNESAKQKRGISKHDDKQQPIFRIFIERVENMAAISDYL
jgi:hypothetical protein